MSNAFDATGVVAVWSASNRSAAAGPSSQYRLVAERSRGSLEFTTFEQHGARREQVAVIVDPLHAQLLDPPIVGIANQGNRAVRLRVGLDELEHAPEPGGPIRAHRLAMTREEKMGGEKGLEHQTVIGG